MATPYGYYGNTLTDIQTGINQAAQIEQQRMAAQEAARAQRFNALMEMRANQARNQAALQQSNQQNAFNMAGLQQEERIAGLDRGVRERELEAARQQREAAERERNRLGEMEWSVRGKELEAARQQRTLQEIQRIRENEAARRHDLDLLEKEQQFEMKMPDPRIAIERERNEYDRYAVNTASEAAARQANALLNATKRRLATESQGKADEFDTVFPWRSNSTARAMANTWQQDQLATEIAAIGTQMLGMGANVRYNPETGQFEAIPIEPFPTTGIPGAAGPVQAPPPGFAPPSRSTFNQVPPTSPLYGQPLPPRTMRPGPQTMAPASEYPIGQFGPSQTMAPNPSAPPGVTLMAPGSPGTLQRFKLLPDGSILMPDGRIIPASP